jgi:hypothetical protein
MFGCAHSQCTNHEEYSSRSPPLSSLTIRSVVDSLGPSSKFSATYPPRQAPAWWDTCWGTAAEAVVEDDTSGESVSRTVSARRKRTIGLTLHPGILPGRRRESHPPSPTDPDVNLSAHPARAVQLPDLSTAAPSARTGGATVVGLPSATPALVSRSVPVVCTSALPSALDGDRRACR